LEHPWILAEARARLDRQGQRPVPTIRERFDLCRVHVAAMAEDRGERRAVRAMRRAYRGYLRSVIDLDELVNEINRIDSLQGVLEALDRGYQERCES
jgi:tRNA-dihydrouridine synthase